MRNSEHVLQGELHFAHVCARGTDLAEARRRPVCVGVTPVRVVREIEGFEPELDRVVLNDSELLADREVPLDQAGSYESVPAGVTMSSEWLNSAQLRRLPDARSSLLP